MCVFWSCSEHFGQGPRSSDFGAQFSGVIKCITNSTPPQKKTNGGLKFQVSREKMQGTKLAKLPFPEGSSRDGFFSITPRFLFPMFGGFLKELGR